MVTRTFLDKVTTIIKGSEDNFGLNPIGSLFYGPTVSRILVHFNVEKIKKEYSDVEGVKHYLKMTNCGSLNSSSQKDILDSPDDVGYKKRAASFKIMALRIPDGDNNRWDEGTGFDNSQDFWLIGDSAVSTDGANWFQSYNGMEWKTPGIFSTEEIYAEINRINSGISNDSFIIDRQTFDHGNENMNLDITRYVEDVLSGKHDNNGLCICFYPYFEDEGIVLKKTIIDKDKNGNPVFEEKQITNKKTISRYVGFFTNNTRTFFEPVVESRCEKAIHDEKNNFIVGKENKIYLFLTENGEYFDNSGSTEVLPICVIDEKKYEVTRERKGIYYASVNISGIKANTILYAEWSDIFFEDGTELNSTIEQEIVTRSRELNGQQNQKSSVTCSCSGINRYENLNQGEERMVKIDFNIPYTREKPKNIKEVFYRLYVMDGENEVDVISYDVADLMDTGVLFKIHTGELVPNEYYVDIKAVTATETRIFKKELVFRVVGNSTEKNI